MAPKVCPPGQIRRVAFVRGNGTRVPAACIKDRGLPGKAPPDQQIPITHDNDLARFGYYEVVKKSAAERREALEKAVAAYGPLKVYRKLNAVMVLTRNTVPKASDIFRRDRDWVGKKHGYGI